MIVHVEGRTVNIKEPTPVTLRKYGLSLNDWKEILARQGYRCPICKRFLEKRTNIDHMHVTGWRRMSAERRKLYVRGITCWYDNKVFLAKGITLPKIKNLEDYLSDFEKRRPRWCLQNYYSVPAVVENQSFMLGVELLIARNVVWQREPGMIYIMPLMFGTRGLTLVREPKGFAPLPPMNSYQSPAVDWQRLCVVLDSDTRRE